MLRRRAWLILLDLTGLHVSQKLLEVSINKILSVKLGLFLERLAARLSVKSLHPRSFLCLLALDRAILGRLRLRAKST